MTKIGFIKTADAQRVWHPKIETPGTGYVLGDINGRLVTVSYYEQGREYTAEGRPSIAKCRRWCYVSDLMKLK